MDNRDNITKDASVLSAGHDDKGEDSSLQTETNQQDGSKPEGLSKNPVLKKDDETENSDKKDRVDGSVLPDEQDDRGEDSTLSLQTETNQQDGSKPEGLSTHVLDSSFGVQRDVQKQEQTEGDPQNVPDENPVLKKDDETENSDKKDRVDGSVLPDEQDDKGEDSTPSLQTETNQQDGSKPEGLSKNPDDETEDSDKKDRVDASVLPDEQDDKGEDSTPSLQTETNQQDGSKPEGLSRHWPVIIGVVMVAVLAVHFLHGGSSPEPRKDRGVDIFRREFEKVKSSFPSQRAELWKRSKIHLERHLQTAQPTEPVSMILTSGHRAERTLRCLASHVAAAFSSALNASVLHIDGVSSATLESDQVKLDIDEKLRGAFQSNKRAAVIHRFEELPPGSTLIFYRYCDHENAAFKGVSLIFTVLLAEDELNSHLRLSTVEEIVQDQIQDKFLSSAHPASFDKMDMDKFSGLWSRISHLILPVAAEEHIEQQGCKI